MLSLGFTTIHLIRVLHYILMFKHIHSSAHPTQQYLHIVHHILFVFIIVHNSQTLTLTYHYKKILINYERLQFSKPATYFLAPRGGGRGERMLVKPLTLLFFFLFPSNLSPLPSSRPFPFPPSKPPTLQRGLLDRPGRRRVHTRKASMQAYCNMDSAILPQARYRVSLSWVRPDLHFAMQATYYTRL